MRNKHYAAFVAATLLYLPLAGCGTSESAASGESEQTETANGDVAPPAMVTPAPSKVVAFDPEKIGPGDLWTGASITNGFGISCPVNVSTNGRPDMLGVALGASLQDTVGILACRYPDAKISAGTTKKQNPYVARNGSTYGLKMEFKPMDGRPYESIDVFLSGAKGDEKVVGLWRAVYYNAENAPLRGKIIADMTAKYGSFDGTVSIKSADGQRLVPNVPPYSTCMSAVNIRTASYSNSIGLRSAADAGCGDTIAFIPGVSENGGLAGEFISFIFNPTYGAQQEAISAAEAQSMNAARTAESRRQAGQLASPDL